MIHIIRLLLVAIFGLIAYGYYLKETVGKIGDKYVGIAVLIITFVFLPLFIYHRYKNKKLSDFQIDMDKIREKAKDL
jgi:hypothetical protein